MLTSYQEVRYGRFQQILRRRRNLQLSDREEEEEKKEGEEEEGEENAGGSKKVGSKAGIYFFYPIRAHHHPAGTLTQLIGPEEFIQIGQGRRGSVKINCSHYSAHHPRSSPSSPSSPIFPTPPLLPPRPHPSPTSYWKMGLKAADGKPPFASILPMRTSLFFFFFLTQNAPLTAHLAAISDLRGRRADGPSATTTPSSPIPRGATAATNGAAINTEENAEGEGGGGAGRVERLRLRRSLMMNRYCNTKERIVACQRRVSQDGKTDKEEGKKQPKKKAAGHLVTSEEPKKTLTRK